MAAPWNLEKAVRFAEYVAILSVGNRTGTDWKNSTQNKQISRNLDNSAKSVILLQGICTNVDGLD
ncbi:MAG: hypothetical protein DRQ02_09855 [Candidatus Latescibacterota bacterium]|nr:MAG: hypothetical protein DRQ02_09855 [Candidatus Latescibacterota bacterium]